MRWTWGSGGGVESMSFLYVSGVWVFFDVVGVGVEARRNGVVV